MTLRPYLPVDNSPVESSGDAQLFPERELLRELLTQAIRDIIRITTGPKSPDYYHGRRALLWLEDDSESSEYSFTFSQVCEYLNLPKEEIRTEIKRRLSDAEFQKQIGCGPRGENNFYWRRRVFHGEK